MLTNTSRLLGPCAGEVLRLAVCLGVVLSQKDLSFLTPQQPIADPVSSRDALLNY